MKTYYEITVKEFTESGEKYDSGKEIYKQRVDGICVAAIAEIVNEVDFHFMNKVIDTDKAVDN